MLDESPRMLDYTSLAWKVCDLDSPVYGGSAWATTITVSQDSRFSSQYGDAKKMYWPQAIHTAKQYAKLFKRTFAVCDLQGNVHKTFRP